MLETSAPQSSAKPFPLEFRGQGKEYFKIWIVNIGLTILTMGIFSAWAKVRTRRYFYNHLFLNGQSFDYHAEPLKILKGRLLLAAIGMSFVLVKISVFFVFVPFLIIPLLPYFLVRGAIFNFSNTSYRGVRFNFQRVYNEAYVATFKNALILFGTLGIGALAVRFRIRKFIIDHVGLGKMRMQMGGTGREFWNLMMKKGFLLTLSYFVIVFVIIMVAQFTGLGDFKEKGSPMHYVLAGLGYLFYGAIFVMYQVHATNFYAKNLKAEGVERFSSKLQMWDTLLFYAEQGCLLLITLGFAWPWVQIAVAKYKAEHFAVVADPEFFTRLEQAQVESESALGEEIASFWDFDIGF